MTRAQRLFLFLALMGAGAVAIAAPRRAAPVPGGVPGGAPAEQGGQGGAGDFWTWVPPAQSFTWLGAGVNQAETSDMESTEVSSIDPQRNVRALLEAIAWAEGTANQRDPYRVTYAYKDVIDGRDGIEGTFDDWLDHPYETGEWPGVVLTAQQCRGAGLNPGCKSTAAGKYQITVTTWRPLKKQLRLPDFSPASQDAAAIELLRQVGAIDLIRRGDLVGATAAARRTWASLPGANYAGQGMRTPGQLLTAYLNAGGALA